MGLRSCIRCWIGCSEGRRVESPFPPLRTSFVQPPVLSVGSVSSTIDRRRILEHWRCSYRGWRDPDCDGTQRRKCRHSLKSPLVLELVSTIRSHFRRAPYRHRRKIVYTCRGCIVQKLPRAAMRVGERRAVVIRISLVLLHKKSVVGTEHSVRVAILDAQVAMRVRHGTREYLPHLS